MAQENETPETKKPELVLLSGRNITAENIDRFYERLTGKKVTPEEHERSVALAAELNAPAPETGNQP